MATGNGTSVQIIPNKGNIEIECNIITLVKDTPTGNLNCYIPGFDIFFNAKDEDSIVKKAMGLAGIYFDSFMLHTGKLGLKKLVLDLNSKGFRSTNHQKTMVNLLNNRLLNANFKQSDSNYENYERDRTINLDSKFSMAI